MSILKELRRRNVFRVAAAYMAVSWLLLQLVTTISPLYDIPDATGRILVVILAIGFIPALILAWAFEFTPEGIKKDIEVDHSTGTYQSSIRRFDRIVIALLTLAVVLFSVDRFVLEPMRDTSLAEEIAEQIRAESASEEIAEKSIAVLPFKDLSENGDQQYFSDGISEELLNLLAKIPQLRVAARTSAFSFKDSNATVMEIAEKLNVSHVLEGSVRRAGDRLRITAQLIEANTDTHLWSDTYERDMGDVFAIQDEIAGEVIAQLRIELLGEFPKPYETTPENYSLFLQALNIARNFDSARYREASELLETVIAMDPDYFPAYDLLHFIYDNLPLTGEMSPEESFAELKRIVDVMATRWPDESETNYHQGIMVLREGGGLAEAAGYMEKSVLNSMGQINAGIIPFLLTLNRTGPAIDLGQQCIRQNTLNMVCYINLMEAYFKAGQFDQMEEIFTYARSLDLGFSRNIRSWRGMGKLLNGDPATALEIFTDMGSAPPFEPRRLHGMAMAYFDLGMEEDYQRMITRIRESYGNIAWFLLSDIYAYTGDLDAAYEELVNIPEFQPSFFDPPIMHVMRDHPQWQELAEKAGIWPEDYRESIPFDITPAYSL